MFFLFALEGYQPLQMLMQKYNPLFLIPKNKPQINSIHSLLETRTMKANVFHLNATCESHTEHFIADVTSLSCWMFVNLLQVIRG